ncbi:hypothetical protein [Absidia glauca]|uniref:Uncharacterized protein n=1 Tax=Absidia glauca TaxID=4829 RepID=A0A163M3P3_ABSGL|nr:hypothetical protein [Absidia glauca]
MASQEPSTTMSINKMLQSDEKNRQADDPTTRVGKDYDMAIYSANIEESNISHHDSLKDVRATVIWEGHGLLSNLLRDQQNDPITVTGQISKATGEPFDYNVQVLLQLHPIRRSRSSESPVDQHLRAQTPPQQQQQQQQQVLPSMKTLLAPDHQLYPPYPSYSSSSSSSPPPPTHQSYYERHHHQQNQAVSSVFRPFAASQPPLRSELDFIPPLSSSSSPSPSPYYGTSHQTQQDWPRHTNTSPNPYDDRTRPRLSPPSSHSSSAHPHYHLHSPNAQSDLPPSSSYSTPTAPTASSFMTARGTSSSPPSLSASASASALTLAPISASISAPAPASVVSSASSLTPPSISSSGQRRAPVDTFYHQSRRKKRDTKPPNAGDVRPFIEVDRDYNGRYILPVEVDSWTVLDLGSVVWDRVAFHNQRYLYPVGYCVKKWYRSMVDPHSDTQYTCQILDGGDEPIFQLEADDNPGEVWRGPTPTTVWTIAVRRAFNIRQQSYSHNPVGPDFFGLRKNTIAKMIQDLPNADKCKNYIWQNFEAITTTGTKNKAMRRSNTRVSTSSSNNSISSVAEPSTAAAPTPTTTTYLSQSSH